MSKFKYIFIIFLLSINGVSFVASDNLLLTVEEQRIEKARQLMPSVLSSLKSNLEAFNLHLSQTKNLSDLQKVVIADAHKLWLDAINIYAKNNQFDDRPLYWARLQMTRALRQTESFKRLQPMQKEKLLWQLELLTRGQRDVKFDHNTQLKILVTGFDPFFLDWHLDQSNPSGAVAMALDDLLMTSNEQSVEIESLIVPVRFEDFDKGMIEELLTPYLVDKQVDMIITVSMGRDAFDLERFPGLRRSAKAPDNQNVLTGASAINPLIPRLKNKLLKGPEFIEFSLPAKAMANVPGEFEVNDNHEVTTTKRSFSPLTLNELSDSISVQGSGGGYLSNEISYRSLVLRDSYNPGLPVGHIHTPRFNGFKPEKTQKIIEQIKLIISKAAAELSIRN